MKQRFVVIDVETTGNSPKKGDRIIQLAAVVIENGKVAERFSSFVNPLKPIPHFIEQLTGISNEMVKDAAPFEDIAERVSALLSDAYFVAHNVHFDLSFIQEELERSGLQRFTGPVLDTVELSRIVFPGADSYKLSELCEELNIRHDNPHRADSDAEVTGELFVHILKKLVGLPPATLQALKRLSRSFISDIEDVLEDIISERLLNLSEPEHIEVFRSIAIKKHSKQAHDHDSRLTEDFQAFSDRLMSKNGPIAGQFQQYEVRTEQVKMMKEIYESFQSHQHALIEAGTGTGKTLAYLIPVIYYAMSERKSVLVSTYTNALQQQVMAKEFPMLRKAIDQPFHMAVLKGKSHYLCLRKFEKYLHEDDYNYDNILTKSQLLIWLTETETGDFDELNLPSGGKLLWQRLHYDEKSSNSDKNPWLSRCFFKRAYENAKKADVVITNHNLLLSSISSSSHLLDDVEEVIIDEAHHFERIACEHLGTRMHYLTLQALTNQLGNLYTNGLLRRTQDLFSKNGLNDAFLEMDAILKQLVEDNGVLFSTLHSYVLQNEKEVQTNRITHRFKHNQKQSRKWLAILEVAARVKFQLHDLMKIMNKQKEDFHKIKNEEESFILYEYFAVLDKFGDAYKDLDTLFFKEQLEAVKWIEIESRGAKNAVSVYSQPVSVSEQLADGFFAEMKSVILTSATLTVDHSFDYMIRELGLADYYPKTFIIKSPFEYKKQAKLMIPSDFPAVQHVTLDEYTAAIAKNVSTIAKATKGKLLVLFTAYDMLKKTNLLLKADSSLEDFMIMGQGGGSISKLTKNFRQFDQAILLGTSTFWEGMDFPGDELTTLIIVRLPFSPPDDPVVAAKCEQITKQGENAFYNYSLPEAILKFKQGFGRLIRTERDKGLLFVFDKRIIEAKYGRHFIASLPSIDVHVETMERLHNEIVRWNNNE
ncbi:ATP-dependent DNA helicase DinG [Metabacillus hrfriensis]|uniref:ATP-dependent DNA helicase DinG n=1 Tax=Metabacillus hrfriensis TaxID=3048891 RepID=A0ACD4R743_9BACI|nr:ATP-dependent DNA helicase DinG [Metabacillus sp. CT-WN-B3]WHZ56281.1 ATP-dependent DNA helicase DinG [Metabacillus sp. CT-WN-B3]